jgi:multidrug efflux pump subunit AcrA (membrane-fusion protein)
MEEHDKIELRSEDVQEILGTPPVWIVRWGTTLIFFGVAMLFWVSWIVKYSDKIFAPIAITTESPPVPVVARTTGYLSKLIVKDGDSVATGDLLVVLQSTANYEDVLLLEKRVSTLDSLTPSVLIDYKPEMTLRLGDIQLNYSSFVQILKEYQFKNAENFGAQNVAQLQQQIKNTERQIKSELDKLGPANNNLALANNNFGTKQKLYIEKVLPLTDLQEAKKEVNRFEQEIKDIYSRVESFRGQKLQLEKSILEVNQTTKQTNSTSFNALVESINQLKSVITQWKERHLLTAPIAGKISFFNNFWAEKQDIKENDEVMAIVPPNGDGMIGIVALPMPGSGKVKEGQRVIIKFDSYPYQEKGIVEGIVVQKALLPKNNSTISVRVNLPNGLKTSYNEKLKFEQQMQGTAEIITEERRMISRMFDKIISAFKNN